MAPKITEWASKSGEFKRQVSSFRNWIKPNSEYPPEMDRYQLIISYACPWACRTLTTREIKGLQHVLSVKVVHYEMGEDGWRFEAIPSGKLERPFIRDYYYASDPNYQGRYTVPLLYDTKTDKIVNNESSEIIRILNKEFNQFAKHPEIDLYPSELQSKIDEVNDWIYNDINNGVYKTGFATKQDVYETNCGKLFQSLDKVELILSKQPFLTGTHFTEADLRLFVTTIRFDPVYFGHFKCNLKSIKFDYPNILKWQRRIYQFENVKDTVNMEHIKGHYYMSHTQINPNKIVGLSNGPDMSVPVEPLTRNEFVTKK
eukprot:NODE_240_length_11935_cov_0.818773.p4 type:complete len:315 gc:universal NODE_240_length_11935_cov_0.818773:9853-10797(+)